MKRLKKAIIFFALTLLVSSPFLHISAKKSSQTPISPALSIIAEEMNMKKCGLVNSPLYFKHQDFRDFLSVNKLDSITINTLPSVFEGTIYLGDVPVITNQTVSRIDMNKLRFVPASNDVTSASFRFSGNGISCESSVKCSLFLFDKLNTAPVITQNVISTEKLTTKKNIMVYSTLSASDAENDELYFEVSTEPKHGIVRFVDNKKGVFTYTPAFDYTGKDKFEFSVSDIYGNKSEKAVVEIKVEKNENDTFYSDMIFSEEHLDAVKVDTYGIMSGKLVDGKMCFSPNNTPTKAEFLQMAMKASGVDGEMIAVDTAFTDDSDIPLSLKGYVSYAAGKGYIEGTKTENGVFFYPNSPITRAEAAVLINNIIKAEGNATTVSFVDSDTIPSWAQEDIDTLAELKIMEALSDGSYSPNTNITNAQAAKIFCKIYEMKTK
ncbi:MAG: S-layer homology domain-containing protein [Clostridia bacterium]|nr:S-layer homology domain-containing protein [Clostridia bacterium]